MGKKYKDEIIRMLQDIDDVKILRQIFTIVAMYMEEAGD